MIAETEWEDSVNKRIQYMVNHVWDGLKITDVEAFLKNFETNDRIVGLVLLDMLIYYSSEQEKSIIANLIRLMKRDIWIDSGMAKRGLTSCEIELELQNIYRRMCLVPVDDSDPSSSSFALTSQFKMSEDIPSSIKYIDLCDVPVMLASKYKYFVFYDDLIGTGTQFDTFWNDKKFGKTNKKSLKQLAEKNPDVKFYYLAMGGCADGVELLERDSNVRVIVSEYFSKNFDIFSDENEYWELNPGKKELVLTYIENKEKELGSRNDFGKNLSILFQHGRASNTTLSLYWNDGNGKWKNLYKR